MGMTAEKNNNDTLVSVKHTELPLVLAGPIVRKATAQHLCLWLVCSQPLEGLFSLYLSGETTPIYQAKITAQDQLQVGRHAWVVLAQFEGEFPTDEALDYQLLTQEGDIVTLLPHLRYGGEERLSLIIKTQADYVLHGSCRNPHHESADSLVAADAKIATQAVMERPSLLMMSGDQIYADHVAGPTLDAIEQVISLLGLPDETFPLAEQATAGEAGVGKPLLSSQELYQSPYHLYGRDHLLPHHIDNTRNWNRLCRWLPRLSPWQEAIFSSRESENHLITFAEYFAMYLLVWSPTMWQYVDIARLEKANFVVNGEPLADKWQKLWQQEKQHIERFIVGLPQVQRLMAHIPTYMIFDDHDVTDDWNLTVGWEKAAFDNLLSRRVIGNGLLSYWLCQGWGNAPEHFDAAFLAHAQRYFVNPSAELQDAFIAHLYRFEHWHYTIETQPKMLVLDTRTRRWRSESKMNKPSGLMDWEALVEMQQAMLNQPAVIIVSAAPMFGVKFIEMLQRIMTWFEQPLLIDAENWMAHPGSANTLLSIFTHTKTPTNFVILSGDVHYSFAYDIKLRFRRSSPNIFQITSSGIKNEFPNRLLRFCDLMDRLLYSPRSPLNWLTKRKRLKIYKRDPDTQGHHRLVNRSAIGELRLDAEGKPIDIAILTAEGERVSFPPIERR